MMGLGRGHEEKLRGSLERRALKNPMSLVLTSLGAETGHGT